MFDRWYNKDPRVGLAVECLEKADRYTKKRLSKGVIQKAKSHKVFIFEFPYKVYQSFYNDDATLRMALDYFKSSPPNIQKALAEFIIVNIQSNINSNLDKTIKK